MDRPNSEFTDTYSDDMIFLQTVRRSLLRHPLGGYRPLILDATLARLYAVMLVGNAENTITKEYERTSDPRLKQYLDKNTRNEKKVEALRAYLQNRLGGAVDTVVLDDYLAIKYLRNGIIHSNRTQREQAKHVTSRGFPLDSRELSLDHLCRFAQVDQAMTQYLGMSHLMEVLDAHGGTLDSMVPPSSRIATDEAVSAPYAMDEFIRIHMSNLEKVGGSWKRLLARSDGTLSPDLVRELRAASAENPGTARVSAWGRSAKYSWTEIVRLWPEDSARRLVEDVRYRAGVLQRVRSLAAEDAFPVALLPASAYAACRREASTCDDPDDDGYRRLFSGASSLTGSQLLECYALGAVAYELTGRIGMVWIWPLLAQGDDLEFVEVATAVIDLYELARTWYAAIERHESIDGFDAATLENYRRGIAAAQA